jgi:Protein of unknown function (DUF742)
VDELADDDESEIGLTGARFGGGRRRRKFRAADTPSVAPAEESGVDPDVGLTGARFGRVRRRRDEPDPPPPRQPVVADGAPEPPPEPAAPPDLAIVRPYVLTHGRTWSELPVETLVSAVPGTRWPPSAGHRAVVELCGEPRSVAEIGALLGVPLGVARVLVDDLTGTGAVAVHATVGAAGPDRALLERVLAGLRRL